MNILQNPSMALQAVIANRLISLNNSDQSNDHDLMQSSTPIQKRKTHLSNRFLNESFNLKSSNLHLIEEVENNNSSSFRSPLESEETAFDTTKANLRELLISKTSSHDSTCSNKSVRSSFSLNDLSTQFSNQVPSFNYMSPPKPSKKINFGDVSSLI